MSQGTYLVCHATGQEVHVSEHVGSSVRGADDDLVLAAFCEAHAFKHQLVVLGEERSDEAQNDYVAWTKENVAEQYRLIVGEHAQWRLQAFMKAFKERRDEWTIGYFSAVATALELQGATDAIRAMFGPGVDPTRAMPMHIDLFRKHGLMT
jgi:hypothetical protein